MDTKGNLYACIQADDVKGDKEALLNTGLNL